MNSSHGGWKHTILCQSASRDLWSILWLCEVRREEGLCHVWCSFQGHAEISAKQRMAPYHWVKKKCCFTDSFHQCFSRDMTGTNFKIKFFIKNAISKKLLVKIPDPQSHFFNRVLVKIVTGWNFIDWSCPGKSGLVSNIFQRFESCFFNRYFLTLPFNMKVLKLASF